MLHKTIKFFDHLEDRVRHWLSPHPIIYGIISGTALVLFWRGVWETATLLNLHPVLSLIVGMAGLLLTGVFVSAFIGTNLIISGLRGEKKFEEKTAAEIEQEEKTLNSIYHKLEVIEEKVEQLEK